MILDIAAQSTSSWSSCSIAYEQYEAEVKKLWVLPIQLSPGCLNLRAKLNAGRPKQKTNTLFSPDTVAINILLSTTTSYTFASWRGDKSEIIFFEEHFKDEIYKVIWIHSRFSHDVLKMYEPVNQQAPGIKFKTH